MKAQELPIVADIEGYERPSNSYLIHSGCHMADYERAAAHNINHSESPIN